MMIRDQSDPLFVQECCSVIMPCHRAGAFISNALESLARQSFPNWRLIAVDDAGPEDGTLRSLAQFSDANGGEKVTVLRNERNMGVSAARNRALSLAQGEFIAFLDPDDFWAPEYLSVLIGALREAPLAAVAYCFTAITDTDGSPTGTVNQPSTSEARTFPRSLFRRNWINPSQAVCRRASLPNPTFDETLSYGEDWDLWLRLVARGDQFVCVEKPLAFYRRHQAAATYSPANSIFDRKLQLWKKHCHYYPYAECLAEQLHEALSENHRLAERQSLMIEERIKRRVQSLMRRCLRLCAP